MNIETTRVYLRGFVDGVLTELEIDEQIELKWSLEYTKGGDEITFKTKYNIGSIPHYSQEEAGGTPITVRSGEDVSESAELVRNFKEYEKFKEEIEQKLIEISKIIIE